MPPIRSKSYSHPKSQTARSGGLRFALYVRKSTEEDERQSQSLGSQRTRGFELAERTGKQITLVVEEACSAKEPGRPQFNRLLALIDAGQIDGILAWHPDRLSRNEVDGAAITMRLRKGVLKDLAFAEYFFHNSPEGIMMLQMSLSQSQYQVSKLAVDVRRGLEDKIKKGWSPHRAPVGYLNNKGMDKGQKTIRPDPERFALLQKAWGLLLTGGYTAGQLLPVLGDVWGFRTPMTRSGRGGQALSKTTLYALLGNPFYAGYFVHGGQVYKGAHEAMVTLAEFQRTQTLLGRAGEMASLYPELAPARQETRSRAAAFLGLMRCGYCGAAVTASTKIKPSGLSYTYYHCSQGKGACGKRGVRAESVQAQIDAQLSRFDLLPEFYEWAKEDILRSTGAVRAAQDAAQAQRMRALAEAEKKLDALTEMRLRDLLTDAEYLERRRKLMWEREQLGEEVRAYQAGADGARTACLSAAEYMKNAREWLRSGDTSLKRIVARNLGSNFVLREGRLLLEPHPMLARVGEAYLGLAAEYKEIEPSESGSGSGKAGRLERVRSVWSGIWELNHTEAVEHRLLFQRVPVPEGLC